jgi:Peptidase family S41/N-terminal domain of Peptidase_S41 in eukaryotic IRBP
MLRLFYRCALRLHPSGFRERFADEMLSIFDQSAGRAEALRLLLDGFGSLLRQWTLRPEFWHELSSAQQPASDGIPSFCSLDPFRPRAGAVIHGLVLSPAIFGFTCFAIRYSWIHILHVRIREVQSDSSRSIPSDSGPIASASARSASPVVTQRPEQNSTLDLPARPHSALNLPTPATSPASAVQNQIPQSPGSQSSAAQRPRSEANSSAGGVLKIGGQAKHKLAPQSAKTTDLQLNPLPLLDRPGILQAQPQQAKPQEAAIAIVVPAAEASEPGIAERQRVIRGAVANLTKYYVDPDVAQKIAAALLAHETAGDDDAATDGEMFADLLTGQMMEVSHDKYLVMAYSTVKSSENPPAPATDEVAGYRKEMQHNNCTIETARILPHNIGYLKFNAFPDAVVCGKTVSAAMTSLNNADAIIFDLRDNRGGYANMVALLATYLFDHPTHLNDFYDRGENSTEQSWTLPPVPGNRLANKPAFVLTSTTTFSAAEGFSYDLKMLQRATLVGETTSGLGHMGMPHRIDDHFTIRIPGMRVINPISKTNWEGTGVQPDVKVKAADALTTAEDLAERKLQER